MTAVSVVIEPMPCSNRLIAFAIHVDALGERLLRPPGQAPGTPDFLIKI
jgi:hypothetical protein